MMRQLFDKYNISSIETLMDTAIEANVKLFPCSMTMAAFDIKAEDIIEGAQSPCGATAFLDYAKGRRRRHVRLGARPEQLPVKGLASIAPASDREPLELAQQGGR